MTLDLFEEKNNILTLPLSSYNPLQIHSCFLNKHTRTHLILCERIPLNCSFSPLNMSLKDYVVVHTKNHKKTYWFLFYAFLENPGHEAFLVLHYQHFSSFYSPRPPPFMQPKSLRCNHEWSSLTPPPLSSMLYPALILELPLFFTTYTSNQNYTEKKRNYGEGSMMVSWKEYIFFTDNLRGGIDRIFV